MSGRMSVPDITLCAVPDAIDAKCMRGQPEDSSSPGHCVCVAYLRMRRMYAYIAYQDATIYITTSPLIDFPSPP
eukprot:1863951-Rhodomonas_salina.1